MAQLICLANSWKHGERCIAGIDPKTGQWIRPISDLEDGRVPVDIRLIDAREPELLDILEIPLAQTGRPDLSFECENRSILPGTWRRIGTVSPIEVLKFCVADTQILHNANKYVTIAQLQSLPFEQRCSLQLLYATEFSVKEVWKVRGGRKWQGTLLASTGQQLHDVRVTDPIFVTRLESGYRPHNPCLITVSLSMPYRPSTDWEGDDPCWKLIAAVIELSEADLILVEMKRLGWSIEQGRSYLQQTYQKRSRQQLTATELSQFLNYLKSLSTPPQQ